MRAPVETVDYLVIGSGIAGLSFAIEAARRGRTLILTKKERAESNSNYAQGGIAGVMSAEDSFALHVQDTLTAGAGLCHEDAVRVLVEEGPERIRWLMELGAQFSMEEDPSGNLRLALGREGGHSRNRIVHAVDRTGWEMERVLLHAARDQQNLSVLEHFFVLDIAMADGQCAGVFALDTVRGGIQQFRARATLIATGGCGQVYRHTTNPAIATGDGVAMAWRAGAAIANMEFIQFHPTALFHPEGRSFLISEAVRGEGGILRTADGSTFMEHYHPLKELAPRDIVARAIHAERLKRGEPCVYLDVTHRGSEYLRERFPTIFERCLALGLDMGRDWLPVVPAAHYQCGGIRTDLWGQTSIPGLYAAGEVTCSGVHGANRLASNSLLEALVFGRRAALRCLESDESAPASVPEPPEAGREATADEAELTDLRILVQGIMNDRAGIVRTLADLEDAALQIQSIRSRAEELARTTAPAPDTWELLNLATVAEIIVQSALRRRESRGLHYITDFPERDDTHWLRDTVLVREA